MKENTAINWIIKNSKSQRLNMALLIFANAVFSILTVAFAYVIKHIIDGATSGDANKFLVYAIVISVIVLMQFVLRLVIQGLGERIQGKLEIAYKSRVFASIQKKKYSKISSYHSGDLMNRLTADVSVVSEGVATIIPTVVASVVRLASAIALLVVIDWVFAVAFVVCGLLVFSIITLLRGVLKSLHKRVQETDGKTRSFMQECLENVLAIKTFSVEDKTEKIAKDLQESNFKMKMRRKNVSVLGNSVYSMIFSVGYVFALIFGGVRLLSGAVGFGYGDLSAILQLVNSVQVPFASLSGVMTKLYATTASAERLMEIEQIEEETHSKRVDAPSLYRDLSTITVSGVSFSYGRDQVYKDAHLELKKGESVAIVGSSGIGKSTIMKLLLGVYPLDAGEIYFNVNGEKVAVGENTRSMFSYVPQGNMLFSGTIRDNVTFINDKATEEEIARALKLSCADGFISELPQGLDTVVGENGLGLSEGQVQRIAIARAVLADAPIILLDEATGALDQATEKQVIENLLKIENVTVILVSHRKTAMEMCDRKITVKNKSFC